MEERGGRKYGGLDPVDEIRAELVQSFVGLQLVKHLRVLLLRAVESAFDLLEVELALEGERVDGLAQELDIGRVIRVVVVFSH